MNDLDRVETDDHGFDDSVEGVVAVDWGLQHLAKGRCTKLLNSLKESSGVDFTTIKQK